jgi:hypothetical protein
LWVGSSGVNLDRQEREWLRFQEDHPDLVKDVEDYQPSREEVLKGVFKSPSAVEGKNSFRLGSIRMVGWAQATNLYCGKWLGTGKACLTPEKHDKLISLDGKLFDSRGKTDFLPIINSCNKPSCSVCYERYAIREADSITFRLNLIGKHLDHAVWGDVEHVQIYLPADFWGLACNELIKIMEKGLEARGFSGVVIPHHARFKRDRGVWVLGVHGHALGFVKGTMRKCRGCSHCDDKGDRSACKGCDGFYGKSLALWKKDRLIVEVLPKRKSVFGTAFYQLTHATYDTSKKRHNVVHWMGICSYRRAKIPKAERIVERKKWLHEHRAKCRICGGEMGLANYVGHDDVVRSRLGVRRDARERNDRLLFPSCDVVFVPSKKWGSSSFDCEDVVDAGVTNYDDSEDW